MSARPGLFTVIRDSVALVVGCILIFKQAGVIFPPPAEVNETIVWVAAGFIGAPGILQLLPFRFGGASTTTGSSTPSPSPESSPSSSGAP